METQPQETIGQKIKKWRTERGLTQEGLARKADISYTTFVKIETDVDRTGKTIDVYARGHGGTTGAAHTATTPIYILGNAQVEGTVDGDNLLEDTIEQVNYTQIIEEPIELSITAQKQKYLDIADKMNEERQKAMTRALKKLNQAILFGKPSAGSKTTPRSFGGMKHYIENTSGAYNYNVAGSFTETHLKNVLLEMARRGGSPNTILCSPDIKSVINTFNASNTRYTRAERIAGNFVDRYEGEGKSTPLSRSKRLE